MTLEHILAPTTVAEAISLLMSHGEQARVLAGGTDLMARLHRGLLPPAITTLVSLHRIDDLRGVRRYGQELVIGGATTAAELLGDDLIRTHLPVLAAAADRMASPQIRNVATIGGNLVNASPAGDLINPLLLLDARVLLESPGGQRELPVTGLFTGPGSTALRSAELLVEVRCTVPPAERFHHFEKAGTRPAMECSLVNLGLAYTLGDGCLQDLRIAVGSCAPTPIRAATAEAVLEGQALSAELVDRAVAALATELSPIDDIRGSAAYRRALAGVLLRRLLDRVLEPGSEA